VSRGREEFLLVSLDRLGDLVMTLPALEHVRACFSEARISFLATAYVGGLLEDHPAVDRLYRMQRHGNSVTRFLHFRRFLLAWRRTPPDRVVFFRVGHDGRALARHFRRSRIDSVRDLPEDLRTARHACAVRAALAERVCGKRVPEGTRPSLRVPARYADAARARLEQLGVDPSRCVALHPGVNRLVRRRGFVRTAPLRPPPKLWPIERWVALGRALLERGTTPLFTGSGDETEVCAAAVREIGPGARSAAGELPVLELAGLYAPLRALVAADTGPGHLAAAIGTPVVSLFGPSLPARFAPLAPASRLRVIRHHAGCVACKEGLGAPSGDHSCMAAISVDEVVAALAELAPL
jgi:ADP-heptose:LPS heptosyltransferase